MDTIADHVSACLQQFNSLCSSPTIWTDSVLDEGTDSDISLLKLQNELSRFKVWSGNIGAHKKGTSSLDHRLRDASNIRDQVAELLEDLRESLKDAKDILTGQLTPWDQDLSLADFSDDDSDDESFQVDVPEPSELSQILVSIVEDINCLFRLSVSIHNPSPHDRFKKACLTDTSGYEPFDVQHVCNKLSKAPKPIAERLGKAISRRRQYFKYRELHHHKLASGLDLDDKDQMQSTIASSLPKKLNANEAISLEEDVDDASDTRSSQTSWVTSAANSVRRKIPALPAEAQKGPFECPFCFMMVSITSRNHWKKHVFSDLMPYICIELGCPAPDQDFQRRHQWAGHVKRYHWKTWTCKLGCNEIFDTSQDMKRHLAQKHAETTELTSLVSLLTVCEKTRLEDEPADCPLCGERQSSFRKYRRHVGRHQEDLALFALPHLPGEEDDRSEESDSEFEGKVEVESEVQDESEYCFPNMSGDAWHNPRIEAMDSSDANRVTNGVTVRRSSRWKCPVLSCQYHENGLFTEEQRDHHYREKHSETPVMYECMFKPCPYKSKRQTNCMQHMEKAHGWTHIHRQENDMMRVAVLDTGTDTTVGQPKESLDTDSADESLEHAKDPVKHHRIEMIAPTENRESFNPANVDVLHLRHKDFLYTLKFPRHDIRDGKLRVSKIRELAAGMTHVPESFRHLVELSCKDTKLLIDGTPIRNYGVSRGDTIKVEAPQFRNSNPFSGPADDNPVLGTEENMEFEGKAERDERRAEFSSELRQRAMVESFGNQKVPASSNPQGELREETDGKRTKTGCLTCRKRRIKCDEGKPICNNCIKSKRHCEGYSQVASFGGSMDAIQGAPIPEIESDLEKMDTPYASGPIQPSTEADHKVVKSSTPGVRCPTCALEGKEEIQRHPKCRDQPLPIRSLRRSPLRNRRQDLHRPRANLALRTILMSVFYINLILRMVLTFEQHDSHGDADSSIGTDTPRSESSTASVSASILEYRRSQGRTYHSDKFTANYFFPNDDQQVESMDLTHHYLTLLLDGELFLAPFKIDSINRVLDVGTGSGIWAIEFADRYPNTEVVGTDLSPCQPQWVPPNLRFEIDDATQPWTWKEDYFSFIHIRYLFGAIKDWNSLFSEAYRCCAPGGWVQSGEADVTFRSDDGTTELEPVFKTYQKLFEDGSQILGNPFFVHDLQQKAFEEAGFKDIETVDYKFPIGGWPKDPKLAEVGRFVKATLENDLEGYTLMMWQDVCQWPKDEYQVFLMTLRKAIRNPKVHSYMTVRYVYGRK
ncbi:zinc finger transcription factor ace1 [Fusarium pseudocircinatum]|uniref:Zinc finger transcription factor ace1 n=1 Tax=Fusarium pseudocircinatum TaxID=56676 RepID=A0A8H5L635_9HYPO|nr:zinc finger transcription factor ace1 [Fusarium pseudocircinatum]